MSSNPKVIKIKVLHFVKTYPECGLRIEVTPHMWPPEAKMQFLAFFFFLARLCVTVISTLNGSHSAVFRDNQKIPKRVPPWYPKLYFEPKKKKIYPKYKKFLLDF